MIPAKSCLAIRSGRFNERNAMLKKNTFLTACLFFTAAWLLFAAEAGALSFSQSSGLVSLKVTPEYKTLSPASKTIDIIAEADIKPGWHLYWDNPGDIGGPTSLSFFESPHYTEIGNTHTAPEKSVYEDIITSYVYTKKVYFRSTFTLKGLASVQRLPFNLVLSYTACSESCLPEEIPLSFALPVAAAAEKNPTFLNTLLTAENTFPVRLPATASLSGELLKLELQDQILKDCSEAEFVSRHPKKSALSELPKTTVAEHNRLHVKFQKEELPPDFKGVLLCPGHAYYIDADYASAATSQEAVPATTAATNSAETTAATIPSLRSGNSAASPSPADNPPPAVSPFSDNSIPVSTASSASNSASGTPSSSANPPPAGSASPTAGTPSSDSFSGGLLYYLITAFIAGLILNLMPCVLPVLSLKALYLVQNRRHASPLSALAYVAGVVCSFMLLAGILFYLRELGAGMGWGFQLQSPVFNAVLLLLFFLIFLNLTDRLPLPDACADTLSRLAGKQSFLTGFFAVVIACPCTGPFMGAAIGYAVAKPALIYFGIFLALSLGYALPYALIEMFPGFFLKYIPKPGHWMITMKRILALPILLTCFWLGWVIFNQFRPAAADAPDAAKADTVPGTTSATGTSSPGISPSAAAVAEPVWEPYTPAKIAAALAARRPVFINFTAKWCLVCLLNDKTSLSTETFRRLAAEKNIALFKADWTNRDETIRDALKAYDRNSIPLYIWYPAGKQTPVLLPQILTPDILKTQLQ